MNAFPKITHAEARLMSPAELAKLENAAMKRAQVCTVPDSKSLSRAQLKAQATARAKVKTAADDAIQARILRALSQQAMTMGEIGDFAGIGRHKARIVLHRMMSEGRAEHFRVENATYWRATP